MRISTGQVYEQGVASLQQRQSEQLKLQQQLSTGRRMLTPADDPIAAANALEVTEARGLNGQYRVNADSARAALVLEEQALGDATRLLQDVKELTVNAGNPVLSNQDRASLAVALEGHYQALLGIANRTDGHGVYLFSGYQGATQPFTETAPGTVAYAGDQGQRLLQIGASRKIAVSDAGSAAFQLIPDGNGTFATGAAASNAGSGVISPGSVLDPQQWASAANSGDLAIRFHVDGTVVPPSTTYDIVDTVNNLSLLTGAAPAAGPHLRSYVPGGAIRLATQAPPDTNPTAFDFGAEVHGEGAPASGDAFTVRASTAHDAFATLHDLIVTLRNGVISGDYAAYQNQLNGSMQNIDNALDNVLQTRAAVGARLHELDGAQGAAEDLALQYDTDLSRLQDLDYARALSDLNREQTLLEAAQKSFVAITGLKLFDYL